MADGTLEFDTKIDTSGYEEGLKKTEESAGNASKGVSKLGDKAKKTGGLFGKLGNLAKEGLSVLTGNLMTQGVNKLKELGSAAIQTGMSFESSVSQLAATMGLTVADLSTQVDEATGEMIDLVQVAQDLGASTAFSASEAADGLNILAMSGLSASEQVAAIGPVLDLAAAGGLSLANAASYTTGAIKGFSDSMDNAQYYTDLIAKGATLANTNVDMLGEALSSASSTAAGYGQTADRTTLALLRLAEQNVTGSEAATALNRAMADLYTPTSEAASALEELRVSAYDAEGNARDFNTVIDELDAALAEYSDEQKNAYKNTIFTSYGLQAFNKMTVTSKEKLSEFEEGLDSAFGSASQQAEVMLDNLSGKLTLMQSATDGLMIALFSSISGGLQKMVEFGTDAITALTKGFNEGGLVGLAKAGADIVRNLILSIAAKAPDMIVSGLEMLTQFIEGLSDGLPALMDSGNNTMAILIETLMNAIPRIINAGSKLIRTLTKAFLDNLPYIVQSAITLMKTFINILMNHSGDLLQAGIELIASLLAGMIAKVPAILVYIPTIVSGIIQGFASVNWGSVGTNIIKGIVNGLKNAGGILIDAAKDAAKAAFNAAKAFLGIHSPSTLFRDVIGRNMALGIGVGFKRDMPIKGMNKTLSEAVHKLKVGVEKVEGQRATSVTVYEKRATGDYTGTPIDYRKLKSVMLDANNEANRKPIFLNGREIDRGMESEAVPV